MATDREVADPGVPITLGGKERVLVFRNWSWMQLEKLQQRSLLGKEIALRSLTDVTHFLWAGLIRRHSELDGFISAGGEPGERALHGIRQVAEWFTPEDSTWIIPKILEAIEQSQPKAEADGKNP